MEQNFSNMEEVFVYNISSFNSMAFLSINDNFTNFDVHFYSQGGLVKTSQATYSSRITLCIYDVYVNTFEGLICVCVCVSSKRISF
jgi:hypothetical protein